MTPDELKKRRDDAPSLMHMIRSFSTTYRIDETELLDMFYQEMTGLNPPARTYETPPTASPPYPTETFSHVTKDITTPVPDDALILWGKHTGMQMKDLHDDLPYVKWRLCNRSRYETNVDAKTMISYFTHFYYIVKGKNIVLMRYSADEDPPSPTHVITGPRTPKSDHIQKLLSELVQRLRTPDP